MFPGQRRTKKSSSVFGYSIHMEVIVEVIEKAVLLGLVCFVRDTKGRGEGDRIWVFTDMR